MKESKAERMKVEGSKVMESEVEKANIYYGGDLIS